MTKHASFQKALDDFNRQSPAERLEDRLAYEEALRNITEQDSL